jgi:hypothetical protein
MTGAGVSPAGGVRVTVVAATRCDRGRVGFCRFERLGAARFDAFFAIRDHLNRVIFAHFEALVRL